MNSTISLQAAHPPRAESARSGAAGTTPVLAAELLQITGHEFRNPLAALRLGLFVLDRSVSPERRADMMDRQLDLLTLLTDDLAVGAQSTRGNVELRTERIDVRTAVAATEQAIRPLCVGRRDWRAWAGTAG